MSQDLNKTMNGTQPSSCYWNPTAIKIGATFALCLIALVGLAGNTVIGIVVYNTKAMRKRFNFLIVNMAISDLLFPIFWIPRDIQLLYTINSWLIGGPLGQALCKLVSFFPRVAIVVSVQSLVVIAVDHFGAVVFPLRSPLISSKLCAFFILATWIIAMAVFSPYLIAFKLVEYPGELASWQRWKEVFGESSSFEHYKVSTLIFNLIPLVLIAILYIIIFLKLKSQKTPGEQSANAGKQRQQRERNVLKMGIAIVLGFAICWLPICIYWSHVFFAPDIWSCGFRNFKFFANFMTRVNCAMNPFICFIFYKNYRKGLKNLFG